MIQIIELKKYTNDTYYVLLITISDGSSPVKVEAPAFETTFRDAQSFVFLSLLSIILVSCISAILFFFVWERLLKSMFEWKRTKQFGVNQALRMLNWN